MLKFMKFCLRKFQNKLLPSHFTTLLIRTNLNWKGLLLFSLNMFISFSDIQSICDLANSTTLKATLFRSARLYARSPESYIILFNSNLQHQTLQNDFTSSSVQNISSPQFLCNHIQSCLTILQEVIIQLHKVVSQLLPALFPHNWSIMWASSSTLPAVSTATKTFPPPLQEVKIKWTKTYVTACSIFSWESDRVNPQIYQRGQVKHH